jgi:hypothetical protein
MLCTKNEEDIRLIDWLKCGHDDSAWPQALLAMKSEL